MGTINYKTSEFITLGLKPYSVTDTIKAIKAEPEEFGIDENDLDNDEYLFDRANEYISDLYDDNRDNVESILNTYDFDYFDVSIDSGYYEGFMIDIEPDFDFYVDEAKSDALKETDELGKMLKELAGVGLVACYPGWSTGYEDYAGTIKEIDDAVETIKSAINETEVSESVVKEAAAFGGNSSVMKLGMYLKRVFGQIGGVNGPRDVKGVSPSVAEVMELNDIYNSIVRDNVQLSEISTMSQKISEILKGFGFNVMPQDSGWTLTESKSLMEAASAYSAKLSQFLDGQPDEVIKWVKKCLNNIFLGIKADYDGYQEGKRPTIKSYGTYKVFKMTIQAISDVKKDSNDVKGKWNFHYPIKDYCANLGKQINKKIDGDTYECVVYNHKEDLEGVYSSSEYDNMTSQAHYPMVGCYSTGIGGSYKNLSKEIPGTTYSIVVSVPIPETDKQEFTNQYMTKRGQIYGFQNDFHSKADGSDSYTLEYDMADGEFVIRQYTEGSADRYTIIYKGRNHMKAFKELVKTFDGNTSAGKVEQLLGANGLKVKHSWWFNPYTD